MEVTGRRGSVDGEVLAEREVCEEREQTVDKEIHAGKETLGCDGTMMGGNWKGFKM